jgi:hypothetical protein
MKNPLFNIGPRPPIISLRPTQQVEQQVLRKRIIYPGATGAEGMTGHDPQGGLVVCGKGDAE